MRPLALTCCAALALAGCRTELLPLDTDGGADLAATCATIATSVQQYLDSHTACLTDSDCARVSTRCGLPGVCGAYVQQRAVAGLDQLEAGWDALRCPGPCLPCPEGAPAACVAGRCQSIFAGGLPVGYPCTADKECRSEGQYVGRCLDGAGFLGGECALPCAHGYGCPSSGMYCRTMPGGTGSPWMCLPACSTDSHCRVADGYRCCPPWGFGGQGNVCYPGPCPH